MAKILKLNLNWHLPLIGTIGSISGLTWLGTTQVASAHHAMGGKLPSNGGEGFLAGLAHPVIGLDHLAFVIAIGLLAAGHRRGWLLPITFVIATMAGTGIHLGRFNLPIVEAIVALSVVTLGLLLALNIPTRLTLLTGLATLAGICHGYAYGESIIGAEPTPLGAYLIGFSAIQLAIALLFRHLGLFWQQQTPRRLHLQRYWGYGVTAIGVGFLAQATIR